MTGEWAAAVFLFVACHGPVLLAVAVRAGVRRAAAYQRVPVDARRNGGAVVGTCSRRSRVGKDRL